MIDLHSRFARLDRVPAPDLWGEIEARLDAAQTRSASPTRVVTRERRRPADSLATKRLSDAVGRSARWIVVLGLICAIVAGFLAVGAGLLRSSVEPSPSPSPLSAVEVPASWDATASMQDPRDIGMAAALLGSGSVLLVGGHSTDNPDDPASRGAELYDPQTQLWTRTGSMTAPRRGGQSLTVLADGRVLVAGGTAYNATGGAPAAQDSAELYDPTTGTWTSTGHMATRREGQLAVLLGDGRVLVAGGALPAAYGTNAAELYDPVAGTWKATGSQSEPRWGLSGVVLADARVLVVGGTNDAGRPSDIAEVYDPTTGTWSRVASPPLAGGFARVVALEDGRVLAVSVNEPASALPSAWLFDPSRSRWAATGAPLRSLFGPVLRLEDGRVLAADYRDGELYDPATGTWTEAGLPAYPGSGPARFRITDDGSGSWYEIDSATLLPDGRVLMTIGPAAFLYTPDMRP